MASDEEEKYFKKLEIEQRERLRRKLEREAAAMATDEQSADLGQRIKRLGFEGETAKIFDLLPLVHVAWADGKIQSGERAAILRVLESRGIIAGSEPFTMMESLLEKRPSQAYLDESLAVLKAALGSDQAQDVVDLCVAVAAVSGGFLGFGKTISDQERALIEHIAASLGQDARAEVARKIRED